MKKVSSKNLLSALVTGVLIVAGNTAFAATQGEVGDTSTGSVDITASVSSQVKISDLRDFSFNPDRQTGTDDMAQMKEVCAWSNQAGAYNITATSANDFQIKSGDDAVSYTAAWDDQVDGTNLQALVAGEAMTGQTNAIQGKNCKISGEKVRTAALQITLDGEDLASAPVGTYSDTLTLVIAAE